MAYARNMRAATSRHYADAELLFANDKFDNAGYHYGFSAECALKSAMERAGMLLDPPEVDGRDAYFVHFPELKRLPSVHAGRLSQKIATMLNKAQFLQDWHIRMRYAPNGSVSKKQCEVWQEQVKEFNDSCMGL